MPQGTPPDFLFLLFGSFEIMFFDNNSPTEIPSRGTFLPQLGSFLPQSGSFLPRHGSLQIAFNNERACACRARALFKKMLSPSQQSQKSRIQRTSGGVQPIWNVSHTFHGAFTKHQTTVFSRQPPRCESNVKRPQLPAPAGNAREPLSAGHFGGRCER